MQALLELGKPRRQLFGASFDYVAVASRAVRGVVRDKDTGKPLAGVSVEHYHGQGPSARIPEAIVGPNVKAVPTTNALWPNPRPSIRVG